MLRLPLVCALLKLKKRNVMRFTRCSFWLASPCRLWKACNQQVVHKLPNYYPHFRCLQVAFAGRGWRSCRHHTLWPGPPWPEQGMVLVTWRSPLLFSCSSIATGGMTFCLWCVSVFICVSGASRNHRTVLCTSKIHTIMIQMHLQLM